LAALRTTIPTENARRTLVASLYVGAGDKVPRSQVARIPPELVIIKPMAMAVARRVWGVALLALHVESVGAAT